MEHCMLNLLLLVFLPFLFFFLFGCMDDSPRFRIICGLFSLSYIYYKMLYYSLVQCY